MDLSKARCMQSAQRVLFVVRRGTTWLFRVTWSFSRWDVDAVARQHAIARAKGTGAYSPNIADADYLFFLS